MQLNNILLAALIAAISVASCRSTGGRENGNAATQDLIGTQAATDSQALTSPQAETRTGHNPMLYCPTPIPDLIEYNSDSCNVSTIRKAVNFGKGLGDGELIINFEHDGPHFIVKFNGREVLDEARGNAESTLAAYDFDGDDIRFKDKVQISAKDTDGDGMLEVIVTAGSHEENSNYIFRYSRDKEPELIKKIH